MENVKEIKELTPAEALGELKKLVETQVPVKGNINEIKAFSANVDSLFEKVSSGLKK